MGLDQLARRWYLASTAIPRSLSDCTRHAATVVGHRGDPRHSPCCRERFAGSLPSVEDHVSGLAARLRRFRYFYLVNHRTKSIYYKIPKAASTYIWRFLRQHGYELEHHDGRRSAAEGSSYSDYCAFAFVRDPLRRALSGYYTANSRRAKEEREGWSCYPYTAVRGEPRRFAQFLADLLGHGNFFLQGCGSDPEEAMVSQMDFLSSIRGLNLSFVGRVEQLSSDWGRLMHVCSNHDIPDIRSWQKHGLKANVEEGVQIFTLPGAPGALDVERHGNWTSTLPWCRHAACAAVEDADVAARLLWYYWMDLVCLGYGVPELPVGAADRVLRSGLLRLTEW